MSDRVIKEEMEHKLTEITLQITANKTFQQKVEGEIKTLKSDIDKESKNRLQLAHNIEENTNMTPKKAFQQEEEAKIKTLQSAIEKESTNRFTHLTAVTQRIITLEADMDNLQEEHTEDTKGTNDALVIEIASITERVGKLEINDKKHSRFVQQIAEIEQGMEDDKQQIKNRIQTVEGVGTELKHLVYKITNEDLINLTAGIDTKLKKREHKANNTSSVLSMFLSFSLSLANPDISHRDANIWLDFLYKNEIYKLVPNHNEINFRDFRKTLFSKHKLKISLLKYV